MLIINNICGSGSDCEECCDLLSLLWMTTARGPVRLGGESGAELNIKRVYILLVREEVRPGLIITSSNSVSSHRPAMATQPAPPNEPPPDYDYAVSHPSEATPPEYRVATALPSYQQAVLDKEKLLACEEVEDGYDISHPRRARRLSAAE